MNNMNAFGTIVVGKRETLCRAGAVRHGEVPLDWPDQGTPERNWALNSALLHRVVAAGSPIRDADVSWGVLRNDDGFLARERMQMRSAGLKLGPNGYWRKPAHRPLIDLGSVLLDRARAAAAARCRTFPIPEAAPVAAWIAARVADPDVRAQAVAWLTGGTGYQQLIRLCARAALSLDDGTFEPVFRSKVGDELEPILSLWPHVLVLPTTTRLSRSDLIRLRTLPVHPLGLVAEGTWADGGLLAPSEYFFHDLDHARFKVREDLLLRGLAVPDAYRDGSTIDARTGRHRGILSVAAELVAAASLAESRSRGWTRRILKPVHSLRTTATTRAAELLLFEMVHEKSLPLEPSTIGRASKDEAHVARLWQKHSAGFYGARGPEREVMNALGTARAALAEICA
jgi:hypothetical protein